MKSIWFLSIILFSSLAMADLSLRSFDKGWMRVIGSEFTQPYFKELENYLKNERQKKAIFPDENQTFAAFELVPFDQVRVVIIGQDPYQTVDKKTGLPYGHGLAFSIRPEIATIPPSLKNIFKKLNKELGIPVPQNGNLKKWGQQGVLMINAILTVEKDKAGSHKDKPSKTANWEVFTDSVIEGIAERKKNVVFLLWGAFARSKRSLIDKYPGNHHLILEAQHPSPLAAAKPSFIDGAPVFAPANKYLISIGESKIDWDLTTP